MAIGDVFRCRTWDHNQGDTRYTFAMERVKRGQPKSVHLMMSLGEELISAALDDAELERRMNQLGWHRKPTGDACRAAAEEIVSETGLHIQGGTALVAAIIARHLPFDRYGEAIEDALAAQPSTAENPNEDAYQLGRFDGVMEYAKAILTLIPHGDDHG